MQRHVLGRGDVNKTIECPIAKTLRQTTRRRRLLWRMVQKR